MAEVERVNKDSTGLVKRQRASALPNSMGLVRINLGEKRGIVVVDVLAEVGSYPLLMTLSWEWQFLKLPW